MTSEPETVTSAEQRLTDLLCVRITRESDDRQGHRREYEAIDDPLPILHNDVWARGHLHPNRFRCFTGWLSTTFCCDVILSEQSVSDIGRLRLDDVPALFGGFRFVGRRLIGRFLLVAGQVHIDERPGEDYDNSGDEDYVDSLSCSFSASDLRIVRIRPVIGS